ncbi:MAG TPA: hypothetical protein VGF00_13245, partial [Acidimicrobiia bacterium]
MQQRTTSFDNSATVLVERVRGNRLALKATALRLSAARAVTLERRDETLRLLGEARQAAALLRQRRAGARHAQPLG